MRERFRQWWQKPSRKRWVVGAIAPPIVLGILWWAWLLPDRLLQPDYDTLSDNEKATLAHQYRGTLIGGIGTIATVVGGVFLYFNFRVANKNAETARKNLELANKRLDLDTKRITQDAELAEDRLISERFAKAVEQLGNENSIHIRLGGIYSLGRLAKDSDEMRQTVLDVLSAFIREKHPKARISAEESEPTSDEENQTLIQELATDVKAALTVIWASKRDNDVIDLSNTDFRSVSLSSANLSSASLSSANLSSAELINANLSGVDFSRANLSLAKLINADLSRANLNLADLSSAKLISINLSGANLELAYLGHANLSGAKLISTNLSRTDLSGANLDRANLSGAKLNYINLGTASLSHTNLSGAILLATDLRESTGLMPDQLTTEESPLLCNVALPQHILDAEIDPNRDCDRLPQLLSDRYGWSLEKAQAFVEEARRKRWD